MEDISHYIQTSNMFQVIGKGGAHAILLSENNQAVVVRVVHRAWQQTCEDEQVNASVWSPQFCSFLRAVDFEMPSHQFDDFVWDLGRTTVRQDLLVHAKDCPLMSGTAIGTILPNFRWLPDSTSTFSVEIKPKCGFLPQSALIHPQNSIKHRVCRYQLHQHLKHEQGETTRISSYVPTDLFGGNDDLQAAALSALLENPQNNIKIWMNGHAVVLPSTGLGVVHGQSNLTWPTFLKGILRASSVLSAILAAQRLDEWDVEGSICWKGRPMCSDLDTCAWFRRWRRDAAFESKSDGNTWREAHIAMHRCSWEEALSMLRRYLIAVAAKDCSIMCAFEAEHLDSSGSQPHAQFAPSLSGQRQDGAQASMAKECRACLLQAASLKELCSPMPASGSLCDFQGSEAVHTCCRVLQIAGNNVKYRVAVMDVDRKHACRIPVQSVLDRSIMQCCRRKGMVATPQAR